MSIKPATTKKTIEHVVIIDGVETVIKTDCKTFGAPVLDFVGKLTGNCAECKDSKHCKIHEQNISDMREAETLLNAEKSAKKADEEMQEMEAKMAEMQEKMEQAKVEKASAMLVINEKTIADLEEELRIAMIPVNAIQEKLKALRPKREVQSGSSKRSNKRSKKTKPYHEILDMVKNGMDKQNAILRMVDMGFKVTVSNVFCDRIYWLHGIATGTNVKDSNAKTILDFELKGIGSIPENLDPSTISAYVNFANAYKTWPNK